MTLILMVIDKLVTPSRTRPKHTLNSTDYKDQNALMDY